MSVARLRPGGLPDDPRHAHIAFPVSLPITSSDLWILTLEPIRVYSGTCPLFASMAWAFGPDLVFGRDKRRVDCFKKIVEDDQKK